jgi:hypothetical protein
MTAELGGDRRMSNLGVVLSVATDLTAARPDNDVASDGWNRAAPAALMIMRRRCTPVRRWSDAVRPVISDVCVLRDHRRVLCCAQDDGQRHAANIIGRRESPHDRIRA